MIFEKIQILVPEKSYLRDPMSSELGQKILEESLLMIDQQGLEKFTFKKLAEHLHTAEASVYRYFENKYKLLIYFTSWYWLWKEYLLVLSVANLSSPEEKMAKAIRSVCEAPEPHPGYPFMDVQALQRILIAESEKSYLIKEVDDANMDGLYAGYKSYCRRLAGIFKEINPNYPFANALSSTLTEASLHQQFFADHLPSLTDFKHQREELFSYLYGICSQTLKYKHGNI